MTENTKIEWCDSTFNPWIGCTKVSPACDHCYAEAWDRRFAVSGHAVRWGPRAERTRTSPANWRQPLRWNARADAFEARHGRRRRVFCASLADVFDNEVPPSWRAELFAMIACTPHLDWLLLTKRIGNVASMIEAPGMQKCGLPANVWLGATIVNQAEADRDLPKLLDTPAAVRFLSIEPMLGDIRLGSFLQRSPSAAYAAGRVTPEMPAWTRIGSTAIDWVICGGESGPKARPMHPDWARSLRDECAGAGVPFMFKQWGEWVPRGPESMGYPSIDGVPRIRLTDRGENGQRLDARGGNDVWMQRAARKQAGRLLDGVAHDGFPGSARAA